MAKLSRIPVLLAWLLLNSGSILQAQGHKHKTRKVLPLEHHLERRNLNERSVRNLQANDPSEQEPTFNSQASVQKSGAQHSAQTSGASVDARSQGGGFLGDGLNIVAGRAASHDGGSKVGPHPGPGPAPHYKSATKFPTYSPVYYPYPDSGKGKGKGSKHSSKSKSKSKGKGKGKGDYSYIQPGGDSIDGGNMGADDIHAPGGGSPDPPAPSPSDDDPQTIDLTPFGIMFELADGLATPTSDEYAMAIDVTTGYLNTYMNLQYEGFGLERFVTTATSTIYRDGVPQIDFTAEATFQSSDPPTIEMLDEKVVQAFTGANLALYLSMLQNLPEENKFSTVTGARVTNPVDLGRRSTFLGSVSTPGIVGAIGAGAFVIVAIGFMIYGKEKHRQKRLPSCPAAAAAGASRDEQTALRPKPAKRQRTKAQILQDQLLRRYNPADEDESGGTSMEETTTCSDDSTIISGLSRLIPSSLKGKAKIPSSIPLNKSVPLARTAEQTPSPSGMSPLEGDDDDSR